MRSRIILTVILILESAFGLSANTLYFDHLDIRNGLSQNTVSDIIQDSRGFLWFGTKEGLNRYDGTHFKVFKHIPHDTGGLGNNTVRSIVETEDHDIMVGTNYGLYLYDTESDSFSSVPVYDDKGNIINRPVLNLEKDRRGEIWISVEAAGIYRYDPENRQTVCCYHSSRPVRTIAVDDLTGGLWFSFSADGLYYTGDGFRNVSPFLVNGNNKVFPDDVISCINAQDSHRIYIGMENHGLAVIDRNSGRLEHISLSTGRLFVRQILQYSPDELWIGTESGLYIYSKKQKTYRHFTYSPYDQYSLSDNAIHSIIKDREGGVWLGTFFGGVNYLSQRIPDFLKYYYTGDPDDIGAKRIGEICPDGQGGIWVGSEDAGLYHLDPATGKFSFFEPSRDFSNIQALLMDGDDLWVSTFAKGIRVIDTRTGKIRKYEFTNIPGRRLFSNNIFALEAGSDGHIYVGTMHGLQFYNREEDNFGYVPQINGGKMVNDIMEDREGNLWVGTLSNGVYVRRAVDNTWKQYVNIQNDSTSLPGNNVISLFEDSKGTVWVTTDGSGFCRFDPDTETFKTFTSSDGMPGDVIYQIEEDDDGLFWISTNHGLVCFDSGKRRIVRVYTVSDGLLCDQFNYSSSLRGDDGTMYFGSIEGLISFNPSSLKQNKYVDRPDIYITDFTLLNEDIEIGAKGSPLRKDITYTDSIELDYSQNVFTIELAVLDYRYKPGLMYRMEGLEDKWRRYDNPVTYSFIAPGNYVFQSRIGHDDTSVKSLYIKVKPPWYRSAMANILYMLFLVGMMMSSAHWYHRRLLLKRRKYIQAYERKKEKEVYDTKIAFFTSITHEIRTPLTLIKGPLDNILSRDRIDPGIAKDLGIMSRNTDRLLVLVNQLLDFQKIEKENMSLDLEKENITSILEEVYSRFVTSVAQLHKKCSLDILDNEVCAMVNRESLTKVISNMMSNAMKYSDSRIEVELYVQGDEVRIVFRNDGEVISPDKREAIFAPFFRGTNSGDKTGTGIGLYLARSLTELQHGSLVMGANPDMNEFILTFPVCGNTDICSEEPVQPEEPMDNRKEQEDNEEFVESGDTVLVVEDDTEMCDFIRDQLSEKWQVFTAANGTEALKVLEKNFITIIVSDIMMPEMDGIELCREVKTDTRYSHIPFILLTAKTSLESKISGMNTGADMYIEKPFTKTYLMSVISNQIRNRHMLREAFSRDPLSTIHSIDMSSEDADFVGKLQNLVKENINNPDFKVDDIMKMMYMSKSNFYRKIKGILDMSPNDYIRLERLKQAAQLLAGNDYQVSEVCYMVGFNSPAYFSKCFYRQFGMNPKDFVRKINNDNKDE